MYHKVVVCKLPAGGRAHIKLHSIDGKTWISGSPRQTLAQVMCERQRRQREYAKCAAYFREIPND